MNETNKTSILVREKILNTIKRYNMISPGDGVVVGFSGGPDSVCLLHALNSLKDELNISIFAVHLNHMIRDDEALRDESFARDFAGLLGIPFYSKRIPVEEYAKEKRMSTEEAGRLLRYELFEEVAKKNNASRIALAHNMNDQAETMLMRFIRGTGISGLGGIKPVRDLKYIRPIISCSRAEIEGYCSENGLNPVIDSTNEKSIYTRNRVRLELIPYIKEHFNPNVIESLYKASEIMRDEDEFLNSFSKREMERIKSGEGIDIKSFNSLDIAVRRRIIRLAIEEKRGSLTGIESSHVEECIELISRGATGKRTDLPGDIQCIIQYDIFKIQSEITSNNFEYTIPVPGVLYINEIDCQLDTNIIEKNDTNFRDNNFVKYFDYDRIKEELKIRNRRDGDYIYPKGMNGRKKLKDIFIDKKIPREKRNEIPLIAMDDEILWAIGLRDTKNYKLQNGTKNVLEIKLTRGVKNE